MTWEEITSFVLALDGTALSTSYGQPAVKANGRAIVSPSREAGSFCLHIDEDTKAILMETDPETFWQTRHYDGWPAVLVRYDSHDPKRVRAMIERARDWAISRKPPRARKTK
jgi:hypothetical protein